MPYSPETWSRHTVLNCARRSATLCADLHHRLTREGDSCGCYEEVVELSRQISSAVDAMQSVIRRTAEDSAQTTREIDHSSGDRPYRRDTIAAWRATLEAASSICDHTAAKIDQMESYNAGLASTTSSDTPSPIAATQETAAAAIARWSRPSGTTLTYHTPHLRGDEDQEIADALMADGVDPEETDDVQ